MFKFIKYVLLILVLIYFFLTVFQFFSDKGYKKSSNTVFQDWSNILEGNVNADLLIVGSSRAYFGYDPIVFEDKLHCKSFNLGYSAAGYDLQIEKLKMYLKRNKKPKYIIQNVDLAFFNEDKLIPNENELIPFLNDSLVKNLLSKYNKNYNFINRIPLLKYNKRFNQLMDGLQSNFDNNHLSKQYFTSSGYHPVDLNFKIDQNNLTRLKKIKAKDLKFENKIDELIKYYKDQFNSDTSIYFVWAPEHHERLKKEYQIEKELIFDYLYQKLENEKSIVFINLCVDPISFNDDNFFDTFHFNRKGANKFSHKLVEYLMNESIN